MLVSFTTTEIDPLVAGATEVFAALNILLQNDAVPPVAAPWDLTGGSATLKLTPSGGAAPTVLVCAIATNNVTAPAWTVNTPGLWARTWTFTDAFGFVQVTKPLPFQVSGS